MVSAPSAPDPYDVADAQGAENRSAAIASSIVNNPNQRTPFGTSVWTQAGNETYTDENGKEVTVPRWNNVVQLSPQESRKLKQQNNLQTGLLGLGNQQVDRLQRTLSKPVSMEGLPRRQGTVAMPNLNDKVSFDQYSTGFNSGGQISRDTGSINPYQTGYGSGGNIQNSVQTTPLKSTFSTGGPVDQSKQQLGSSYSNSFNAGGSIDQSRMSGPNLQSSLGTMPGINTSMANFGSLSQSFGGYGTVDQGRTTLGRMTSDIGDAGRINQGDFSARELASDYGSGGTVDNFDTTGAMGRGPGQLNAAQGYNGSYGPADGFSADRARVEEALMSRMSPDLEQDRAALESRLAAQGLQPGTAAFNTEMDRHTRQVNDARMQSIIAGGTEQSRMLGEARMAAEFGNEAQARQYMDAADQYTRNLAGQQQGFGQQLSGYGANLQAQAQREAQNAARAEFGNRASIDTTNREIAMRDQQLGAQGQQFAQNLAGAQFGNQTALDQANFGIAERQAANAAQGQAYGQALGAAEFGNNAQLQQLQANLDRRNQALQSQQQVFNQRLAGGQFANQAAMDAFGADATARNQQLAAQAQQFGQNAQRAQFGNEAALGAGNFGIAAQQATNAAQQQQFSQNALAMQAYNDAQGQAFDQSLAAGGFANAAQSQANTQNAQAAQFANNTEQLRRQYGLDRMSALNAAQGQAFDQNAQQAAFQNAAIGQNNAADLQSAQFKNQTRQQRFDNRVTEAGFQNANREAGLQERLALRNQPINEISAFMGGSQVNVPQFQSMYRQGIDPAPVGDYVYQSAQMDAANSQAAMSGLFGLGSSLMGLPFMLSDEREKKNKKPLGKTPGGSKVYEYEYKAGAQRKYGVPGGKQIGVMAGEERKRNPAAVAEFREPGAKRGLLAVDYSKVS